MDWQQFTIDLGELDPAAAEEIFERFGACSVTLSDAGDSPVLEPAAGETPLWHRTRITALFPADADLAPLPEALRSGLALPELPEYELETLADREWETEWRRDFGPMPFGERLWICPTGCDAPGGATVVRLDPGLAFGTGTHPTTALCLEWLDGLELADRTMLDYGCGSGVLAIAALKLGCRSATAMDIDPQAVSATIANAGANAVQHRLRAVGDDESITGTFDVVAANILAGPLVMLAESIITRLSSGGLLALSGILSEQVDRIRQAYAPAILFDEPAYRSQGEQTWARLSGIRRAS
jgi:ribosomal protein L11 methyltransferase